MKSRHVLVGEIKEIRRGLALYKVRASPFWRARVWLPSEARYIVKSTKETSRLQAIEAAEELVAALGGGKLCEAIPKSRTFETFADKLIDKEQKLVAQGIRNRGMAKQDASIIQSPTYGLLAHFGRRDVASIHTRDINAYVAWMQSKSQKLLAFSTVNNRLSVLRKVLKLARDEGLIENVPATPRPPRKDNPRPFFRFAPLVPEKDDEYALILRTAKAMTAEKVSVRWIPVTSEFYDWILFLMHSFLRPTESEIYSLRFRDVAIAKDPKRLILTIRKGKTGHRVTNTLEACVSVFERLRKRHCKAKPDDYVFLPSYPNRTTARNVFMRMFNALLDRAKLKRDSVTGKTRSVYSLRHTAICMRLIKSEGEVNIFNLAKTAGTSVEQIERFYARHLPLSREMAKNLQTFGRRQTGGTAS
jgi:integrase